MWSSTRILDACIIEIEQDELDVNITARLPGDVEEFAVPEGVLLSETEYQLGIGTVSNEGNISFVETTFTTAGTE